jgi:F-type H+-transporting ATPase subunit delta
MTPSTERDFQPTADVSALRIARVYAEALLNAATKHNQAEAVRELLDSLIDDVFRADPRIEIFMLSAAMTRHAKAAMLRAAFEGRGGELFTNFLEVLNNHGRLDLLRYIRAAYRELLDDRAHRVRVQVRSAVPLPEDQRQHLERDLREVFQLEPILETQVDASLLGGLTVRVGDWLYDASLRTQLQTIRNQITTRSSYEIQRRRDRFSADSGN